jgi:hypothetical protein
VHGVGPGSFLGGRYVAQNRLSADVRYERWSALDSVLDREVTLLCLPESLPEAPAVLDAARRVASVEDRRLVRVYDVGTAPGLTFVVEERVSDAVPLATLLADGPLPADEARRVTGEVAIALERARARGLHHMVLTPMSVLCGRDGSVKVRGLAVEAALYEVEPTDSAHAAARDARGVVAIAYAALTTRWPLRTDYGFPSPGVDPAPRIVGGVVAPSEIAAGVPADLDLIARQTLRDGRGPRTPGDLANQIAPWSPEPNGVVAERLQARPASTASSPGPAHPPVPAQSTSQSAPSTTPPLDAEPLEPLEPLEPATAPSAEPGPAATSPAEPPPADTPAAAGATAVVPDIPERVKAATESVESDLPSPGARSAVGETVGAAVTKAGTLASAATERLGGLAKTAASRAGAATARMREVAREQGDVMSTRLATRVDESGDLEAPAPLLPPVPAPSRDQSKLALALVAGFVLLAVLLAWKNLPVLLGGTSDYPRQAASATPTRTTTATTSAPTTPAPAALPVVIPVTKATAYDPEGDGAENERKLAMLSDGTPSSWTSDWYLSPQWSGLKSGLGVALDLGKSRTVTSVTVTLVGKQTAEVFVSDEPTKDGAASLGRTSGSGKKVISGAGTGRYVIVWISEPASIGGGKYRAEIAEVEVRGRP